MKQSRVQQWRYGASLLLLGAAHAQAFAPDPLPGVLLPYLQLVCLAFLARYVWRASGVKAAAATGFLFGLGSFAVGLYWVFISMHRYGGMAVPLASAATLLLAAADALFYAAAVAVAKWLTQRTLRLEDGIARHFLAVAAWASCWTLAEWLRGTLFTGFPWMATGYAHVEGPLSGWAPLIGMYGVTWLAAFVSAAAGLLMLRQRTSHEAPAAATVAAGIAAALLGWVLGGFSWGHAEGPPTLVRLVQGNVPQSEKFDPALLHNGVETYMQLAAMPPREAGMDPAVIVLPETIMALFQNRYPPQVWEQWRQIAQQRNAAIIMGVPLHSRGPDGDRYTNSVMGFDGATSIEQLLSGQTGMRYDKHHLVPFGEFVPPGFRWFVDAMHIPLGDFDRGQTRQKHFTLAGQQFAPNICYEDVFGEEIIQGVRPSAEHGPGATILVNVSNLGWFGESWALRQHLQISRMRAVETARPMLRATNTGMTAAIDPDGTVRAMLDAHVKGVLDVEVQGTGGLTPYVKFGNWPTLVWSLLWVGVALLRRRFS
ncbi:apolipoprotein N-acyltransferase [Pusillimonas sp.]|uniref:apolipoprotein N-acyltransferase n=1 Tax=Pusillimonas sp. TaxID=3040095 RepID=UPI0037CAC0BE